MPLRVKSRAAGGNRLINDQDDGVQDLSIVQGILHNRVSLKDWWEEGGGGNKRHWLVPFFVFTAQSLLVLR